MAAVTGSAKRFIPNADMSEKPIKFNRGILIEPPPIPKSPLPSPPTKPTNPARNSVTT